MFNPTRASCSQIASFSRSVRRHESQSLKRHESQSLKEVPRNWRQIRWIDK